MDVQVKLSLQGGHSWDFRCDEDDPIVFGLVSSLPGANLGGHPPPDGLVQVETQTGRLYITRSSLIGVEVNPITDVSQNRAAKRFLVPSLGFTGGLSGPAPFALAHAVLTKDVHAALLEHALGQRDAPSPQAGEIRQLDLGTMSEAVTNALQVCLDNSLSAFNLGEDHGLDLDCRMFAVGDAQVLPIETKPGDVVSLVYHFYNQPRAFTGGGVRLFDGRLENGMARSSDTFRDLEIKENAVVMFPSNTVSAALPVRCPTLAFSDGLFAIRGTLRRGSKA
jgi:SM-20-related protein